MNENSATKTAVVTKLVPATVVPSTSAAASQQRLDNSNIKKAEETATCSTSPSPSMHVWKGNEEDMLVSLRHSRNREFTMVKNHTALWEQIATDISKDLKVNITGSQAFNKYNSLKRRWKEVIDSEKCTGSEPKQFRQRKEFDEFLGSKASTRPKFVIDSNENDTVTGDNQETQPEKNERKIKSSKPKKKKSEVLETIEKNHKEFSETMNRFHEDRMRRYDRLLDLYERGINMKENN